MFQICCLQHTRLLSLLCVTALPLARAWLNSSGSDLISTTTRLPVRLRCVNWYGAHLHTFVAGGLDKRSCGEIAESVRQLGANCVRIPLSVEMVLTNPLPPASAVAALNASECIAHSALEVLDCQVRELTKRGLMVILNSHNSFPGWVGAHQAKPQGLWHTEQFPTYAWVASLVALAFRYKSNALVVGIDIRNEIHDQDGVVITWGKSNDTDSDWKAATLLADAALREVNPNVLVIVSGLCCAYDLRAMQDLENYRSKYVFTTHVYIFSWWFTHVNWALVLCLSLFFVACNTAAAFWLRRHQRLYTAVQSFKSDWLYALAGSILLPLCLVAVSIVWMLQAKRAGCSSIAADAVQTLVLGAVWLAAVAGACCTLLANENEVNWRKLTTRFCCCNTCLGLVQAGLSVFYQTHWAVAWDLRRWNSPNIPVWVGEFGAEIGDTSVQWKWLLMYLADMHYAYWPLNGCFFPLRFNKLINDTYGILECDWTTVRNTNWTASIFA